MAKMETYKQGGVEVKGDFRKIPFKQWLEEGEKLFGKDKKQWKFKCANCGHIQTIQDFIDLRDLGIIDKDLDAQTAYFSCIGRFDTRIKEVGTMGDKISPCNYTLGGLFKIGKTVVVADDGKEHMVFEFAKVKS